MPDLIAPSPAARAPRRARLLTLVVLLVAGAGVAPAAAQAPAGGAPAPAAAAQSSAPVSVAPRGPTRYIGRPIYSEPTTGLQLPPGCAVEASWRARMGSSDHEVWVAACENIPRAWMVRRQVVELLGANQARLRFQVLDERLFNGETAGDSLSVQCGGTKANENGFIVHGARWRTVGKEMKLVSAAGLIRADITQQKFVDAPLAAAECARFPEREAMMRQLQQAPGAPR